MNLHPDHAFPDQAVRPHNVIDTPADVFAARPGAVAPRAVFDFIAMKVPEGVDETAADNIIQAIDLLLPIARAPVVVGPGTGKIDVPVRHVEVATHEDRLAFLQPF